MKKISKVLAVLLAVCLIASTAVVSSFAIGGTPVGNEKMEVKISVDKLNPAPGDTVKVSVMVSNNYNATTMKFPIFFSNNIFELGTEQETDFKAASFLTPGNSGINLAPDKQEALGKGVSPVGYALADYEAVLVQWAGGVSGTTTKTMNVFNSSASVECFSFNLKVKSGLTGPNDIPGKIFIPAESTEFYYQAMNTPTDATTIYYMSKDTCTMTFVAANPVVKFASEGTTYGIVEGSTGVFDEDNKFFYGFTRDDIENGIYDEIIDNYIWVKNGSIAFDFSGNLSGEDYYGTGTVINILDKDGEIIASYTIVIFGDVNGDAVVDVFDVNYMIGLTNYDFEFEEGQEAYMAAADTDGDSDISVFDLGDVINASNYDGYISQTETNPSTGGRYFAEV